jgi:HlyD family secretion protein
VADLSIMEAEVLADETDIRNLTLGQEARVRVDALQRLEIAGKVTEIGSSAIPRGSTTTGSSSSTNTGNQAKDFKVVVTLENPPSDLRPGLNATADIVTARKTQVLAVPIQSVVVREVDKEGRTVDPAAVQASDAQPQSAAPVRHVGEERDGVFVVSQEQVVFRPVKTGILGDTDIEILEGLKEGEEVVTGSYKTLRTLKDRARVKIDKPEKKEKT